MPYSLYGGTPTFGKEAFGTPVFKILVRALNCMKLSHYSEDRLKNFLLRVSLCFCRFPLNAWNRLHHRIVALPESSYNKFGSKLIDRLIKLTS